MNKKIYSRTYWIDHETPVNAKNLNKIEEALYELSEKSLRPSDFFVKENGGLEVTTSCGCVYLNLDDSVLRSSENLKKIDVLSDLSDYDPTINGNFCFLIDDDKKSYKLIYNGEQYSTELNVSYVNYDENTSLVEFLEKEKSEIYSEIKKESNILRDDWSIAIEELISPFTKKIEELTRKINTLSTKCNFLEDKIKDMEDKNNGLEIM